MSKPVSGFIWLIRLLCLYLVLGLPGCSFHNTTIASQQNILVEEELFLRKNIGLIGGAHSVQKGITLNHASDQTSNNDIFHQMYQGAKDGALSGLKAGQFFCGSGFGHTGHSFYFSGNLSGADALIVLILCGGGMVTGMSLGATVGIVAPLVSSNDAPEILIARQHVIQGVWKELVSTKERESSQLDHAGESSSETLPSKGITFGSSTQPFSSFMRLENIHVGLFPKSSFDADALTLAWNLQVTFFDHRRKMLAKQNIEMEQGEYSFGKWADQEAVFLKEKLREGYRLIADEIVGKLTQTSPEP